MDRNSTGITVSGHTGKWYVIDERTVGGKKFFLLEHETWGDEAPCVIVDASGNVVVEDVYNGFEDMEGDE